ncbi:unnamed protein product [Larinioides sclopetarius]|uniref:Uncharacterized protein n=1 Tax=Larinioides sclopetarius TaxID=280406 RepID=A0AAV2B7I9_9ARAC
MTSVGTGRYCKAHTSLLSAKTRQNFSTEKEKCVDTILTNLSDISLLKADLSDFSGNEDLHPVISAQTNTERKNNASPPITNATHEKIEMTHRSET